MAGIYHERHSEHTVFNRVFFYYFETSFREYEDRFEKEYGYFRPVIRDVIGKHLDCSNPMCGFTSIQELTFEAERPPPPHHAQRELLTVAEEGEEYF